MNRVSSAAARSLTIRYTIAFIAIVSTCLASQLLIQSLLANAETHAQVVNIAGRQRMLSQKIAKVSHKLVAEPQSQNVHNLLGELASSVLDFRDKDRTIRFGDDAIGVPAMTNAETCLLLDQIHSDLETIVASADELVVIAGKGDVNSLDVRRLAGMIDEAENRFLPGMEQVVKSIADHSQSQIHRLVWADRVLTFATLAMLFLEAMFVFRPAVQRVSDSIQGLRIALSQARSATETAESAIAEKNVALSAAAMDLKRLSAEIDALLLDQVSATASRDSNRFRMLITHVHNTLGKLTDLATGVEGTDDKLIVSRTSPRSLVRDAVQKFNHKTGDTIAVNFTMDVRLPASMLVDEQLLRDSIMHTLQSVFDAVGNSLTLHVGYDDRELQLLIEIAGDPGRVSLVTQRPVSGRFQIPGHEVQSPLRSESESLDLLLAKRTIERLGGTLQSSGLCDRVTIRLPLDETMRMTLFVDSDRYQIA